MTSTQDYHLITTEAELDALCLELSTAPYIAVDTETEGLNYTDIIVGIALSHRAGSGYYIPIRHEAVEGIRYDNQLTPQQVYTKLKPILETIPCVGHNVKFDLKMFWKDGIDVNYVHDTLIMAHILDVSANGSRGLKYLVKHYLQHEMNDIDSLFPKIGNKKPDIKPKILSPEDIKYYGCEDGNWSMQLFNFLSRMFENKPKLKFVYNIEMRLLKVVAEMESFGVPVSLEFLKSNSRKAEGYLEKLRESILNDIRSQLNDPEYEVNFKSPKQLSTLLFEHLQLPVIKFSARTGAASTDASVLQELAKLSPVVQSILTYRNLEKLNNTYLKGLQDKVHNDGRIRGNFNQSGTASGRFSSSDPNLQNLPKDQTFTLWRADDEVIPDLVNVFGGDDGVLRLSEDRWESRNTQNGLWEDCYIGEHAGLGYGVVNGKIYEMWKCKTRDFIEAPKDHYLVEADYSQVELRIMAGESQEGTLLDAYRTGDDVHKRTAAVIFDEPFEHVTKEQRHIGKTVNFSLLYGAGPYNISQQLQIPIEEAQDIVERYFKNLPNIKSWINRVKQDTKMDGYAETIFGRRRSFPNVKGSDQKLAEKELRESVNHHIQGAAADVMKSALVRASHKLREQFGDRVKIISTVHDSLLLECHNSCSPDHVITALKIAMEQITIDPVQSQMYKEGSIKEVTVVSGWPLLEIDAKVGRSWGSSKDYSLDKMVELPNSNLGSTHKQIRVRQIAHEREAPQTDEDIVWTININKVLNFEEQSWLKTFLSERKNPEANSRVNLTFIDHDGTLANVPLESTYDITFDDELDLRMRLGPCALVQSIEGLDYTEVLRGVDFGL